MRLVRPTLSGERRDAALDALVDLGIDRRLDDRIAEGATVEVGVVDVETTR